MKNLFILSLVLISLCAKAQKGKFNGIDSITIDKNKLYSWDNGAAALIGHLTPMDDENNIIVGFNPTIINSVDNTILGNNVILTNSSGNLVACNNAELNGVNNATVLGADSKLYSGADYSTVCGDAHSVSGYGSHTSGTYNVNACENGVVSGYNNRNGILNIPNQFSNSRVGGHDCVSEGNNNVVEGSYLYAVGDNIIIFGDGLPGSPTVVNQEGVYYVNAGVVVKLQ